MGPNVAPVAPSSKQKIIRMFVTMNSYLSTDTVLCYCDADGLGSIVSSSKYLMQEKCTLAAKYFVAMIFARTKKIWLGSFWGVLCKKFFDVKTQQCYMLPSST